MSSSQINEDSKLLVAIMNLILDHANNYPVSSICMETVAASSKGISKNNIAKIVSVPSFAMIALFLRLIFQDVAYLEENIFL